MKHRRDPRATVFGEVVLELMEARGMPAKPPVVLALADRSGLDGYTLIDRMGDADAGWPGYLDGLVENLGLSHDERTEIACAYSFECRAADLLEGETTVETG